jgi:hypothetical protein
VVEIDMPVGQLVSMRRLGAALNARRARRRSTLTSMSRRAGNWWTPDELQAIEQGAVVVDDASVIALARLYGIPGRSLPSSAQAEIVLDRSIASDLTGVDVVETQGFREFVVARMSALGLLMEFDPTHDSHVAVLAEALAWSEEETLAELSRVATVQDPELGDLATMMSARVVVPETGVLVAETDAGALVVAERRIRGGGRANVSQPTFAGAAPLRSYLRAPAAHP